MHATNQATNPWGLQLTSGKFLKKEGGKTLQMFLITSGTGKKNLLLSLLLLSIRFSGTRKKTLLADVPLRCCGGAEASQAATEVFFFVLLLILREVWMQPQRKKQRASSRILSVSLAA